MSQKFQQFYWLCQQNMRDLTGSVNQALPLVAASAVSAACWSVAATQWSQEDPSAMPRPTSQDLAGFWDLLQLSIDDVTAKFDELQQIKSNQRHHGPLQQVGSVGVVVFMKSPTLRSLCFHPRKERKWPPPSLPKRPGKGRGGIARERSLDLQDRQRQEARRRLLAAKRAASFRQNSATERADSIEIYIPEAQTRL
ncbi:hypothetical protein CRUP_037925 [Coryphaenoides rupestris]|nr:hypothetical protein CRUP_037925 [Coryphaenoides rupestris]